MVTYRESKTGREQQVGENERVRIGVLKRLGWKPVKDAPTEGVVVTEQLLEPEQVGDTVLVVTETPVPVPAPKIKRS